MIPAGLTDTHIELFFDPKTNRLKAIYQGEVIDFWQLPSEILTKIEDLIGEEEYLQLEEFGCFSPKSKLAQYATCRFGGFDSKADFTNKVEENEYWDCGNRGVCPFEGKICKMPKVNNTPLTIHQLKMIQLMATELTHEQVADELNISSRTLDKRKTIIYQIFEVYSRPAFVDKAYKYHLILNKDAKKKYHLNRTNTG